MFFWKDFVRRRGQDAPHLSSNRGSFKSRDTLASISVLAEEGRGPANAGQLSFTVLLKARCQKLCIVPGHAKIVFSLTRLKRIYAIMLKLMRFVVLHLFS